MFQLRRQAAVAVAFALGACLRAGPWPVVQSDLPADPEVRWGVLPNGVRYAVRRNAEPKGRVSLRFLVAAGSAYEKPSERGIAHFIEHMAFRGTREHPNGSSTEELQRFGVGFGPDTAAFTFTDHTVYLLDLPDNAESALREGLGLFREYAQDILFDPRLIDRERDVILNERDTRDTPYARASIANLEMLFPGSLQVRRQPIGLAENIRDFTSDQFTAFYDAWYRPDRMVVIAVGDIDPDAAARLIASAMGGVSARGPARDDDVDLVPAESGKPDVCVFEDKGLPGAACEMEHPFPEPAAGDTHSRRVSQLRRAIALWILQHRAAKVSKSPDGKFVVPEAMVSNPVPGWALVSFGANGSVSNWKDFMADIEREHRRAFTFGFTEAELAVARTAFAAGYENAVSTSATWHSDWIATSIANSIVAGSVYSTPAVVQQDIATDLAATTPADCVREYRRAWTGKSMHVFIATNPAFQVTKSEVAQVLNESRATPVTAPAEAALVAFAYSSFGPAGRLVHSERVADLDVWEAAYANGVRLNFKETSFEAGSVVVYVRVGTGRLSQPKSQPGLDMLANAFIPAGGLGKHTVEDLQDVLAGHSISVNFAVDSDALVFSARCAPKDLRLCLQLITAYLADSAYRPEALPQAKASVENIYSSIANSPSGPITMRSMRILSGGDPRFGTATRAEFSARTIAEVRDWAEPQFKGGPVEMSVVGDTTWEDASATVGATLGSLPQRAERTKAETSQKLNPPQKPSQPVYLATTDPSLRLVAITQLCPVPDLSGIHMERRCRLLAALLAERMRVRLRSELGAAYGFEADFAGFDGFPDFSFFYASTTVAPEHAKKADRLIQAEIDSLRRGRFTDDEFERVKLPLLRKREADLRDNSYWAATVLRDAQLRPDRLAAARDRQADNASMTRAEIEALAARYFALDRWFPFIAYPREATSVRPPVQPFNETFKLGATH